MACAVQALTHYQTYPERPPGADLPPKKMSNLDPMAPRSRQKRQLPDSGAADERLGVDLDHHRLVGLNVGGGEKSGVGLGHCCL